MAEFLAEYGEKKPIVDCDQINCRIKTEKVLNKFGEQTETMHCQVCNKVLTNT
jgi:hypothetical protein